MNHTKGPWETTAGHDSLGVCEADGGDIIAEVVNGNMTDRDLIAAAPDLLRELKELVDAIECSAGCTDLGSYDAEEDFGVSSAKAAIRKAVGS